jgi:hypothetical protein
VPNLEPFNPNDRITVNNVSIKAWQAQTFMVRLEHYFGSVGQVSGAYFIRDYKNSFQSPPAFPATPEFLAAYGLDEASYGKYLVVTQINSPLSVRMVGWELDYKQSLTFLPNWARGVQFFTNLSSQRAKDTDDFQDMNPFVANWGLSFTRQKFNLRINENYRGLQRRAAVTGQSIEPGTYNYRSKRLYIDITGEYYFRRTMGLFFALRNVYDAPEDTKIYGPDTPRFARFRQHDDYASLWTAGIKGTF